MDGPAVRQSALERMVRVRCSLPSLRSHTSAYAKNLSCVGSPVLLCSSSFLRIVIKNYNNEITIKKFVLLQFPSLRCCIAFDISFLYLTVSDKQQIRK